MSPDGGNSLDFWWVLRPQTIIESAPQHPAEPRTSYYSPVLTRRASLTHVVFVHGIGICVVVPLARGAECLRLLRQAHPGECNVQQDVAVPRCLLTLRLANAVHGILMIAFYVHHRSSPIR